MPYQPLRRCSYPGCRNKVKSGRCEEHKPKDNRPSSRARGYDHKWSKYRAQYLKHHPLCVMCLEKGIYTPATVIDHIKPVENGQADPLFWVGSNHQSLCRDCHSYKTRVIDQRGFGAKKWAVSISKQLKHVHMYTVEVFRYRNTWMMVIYPQLSCGHMVTVEPTNPNLDWYKFWTKDNLNRWGEFLKESGKPKEPPAPFNFYAR